MKRIPYVLMALTTCLCLAPFQARAEDVTIGRADEVSASGCAGLAPMTYLQRRVVDKAVQGIVPLRQFVWNTRMIYQLDLMETVAWLDQRRASLQACVQIAAQ